MAKYHIPKGQHYNSSKIRFILSLLLGLINAEVVKRTFMLNFSNNISYYAFLPIKSWYPKSALDKDKDGNPLTGWNKLFGGSGFNIHKYSGRLVWQPDFAQYGWFIIALYVYNKGEWTAKEIARIKADCFKKITVEKTDTGYRGIVSSFNQELPAEKNPLFLKAEPYFGGQSVAPKDIDVYLYSPFVYRLFKKWIHKKHKV
jgi:hypothetical protein